MCRVWPSRRGWRPPPESGAKLCHRGNGPKNPPLRVNVLQAPSLSQPHLGLNTPFTGCSLRSSPPPPVSPGSVSWLLGTGRWFNLMVHYVRQVSPGWTFSQHFPIFYLWVVNAFPCSPGWQQVAVFGGEGHQLFCFTLK